MKRHRKLLYFTASWCNPCQRTKPFAEELIKEGYDIEFIDSDENTDLVKQHDIKSIPTYILFESGSAIGRTNGAKTKQELADFYNQ